MNNTNKDIVKKGSFNFYGKGTTLGILGGVGMALIAVAMAGGESVAHSFVKYLLLIPFLFFGLYQLKNTFVKGNFFKEGILFGAYTSFVAALAFIALNVTAVGVGLRESEKFSYESESLGDMIGFQGVNFFEIIGLGLILTFISLQFLKFRGTNENAKREAIIQ